MLVTCRFCAFDLGLWTLNLFDWHWIPCWEFGLFFVPGFTDSVLPLFWVWLCWVLYFVACILLRFFVGGLFFYWFGCLCCYVVLLGALTDWFACVFSLWVLDGLVIYVCVLICFYVGLCVFDFAYLCVCLVDPYLLRLCLMLHFVSALIDFELFLNLGFEFEFAV